MSHIIILAESKEAFKALLLEALSESRQPDQPTLREQTAVEMLTPDEICSFLKISKTTLNDWMKKGVLPYIRLGKRIYFEKEKIIEAGKGHEKYQRKK